MIALTRSTALAFVFFMAALEPAHAEMHEVLMLNRGESGVMVFEPALLRISPGDTVKFVAADNGHNSESIDGMTPTGGITWQANINEEGEITFEAEGVYGYKCRPHYGMGMVGLIVVGTDPTNVTAAQEIRQPGKAKSMFEQLFSLL